MTAAVPEPRFRDQLAEVLWRTICPSGPPLDKASPVSREAYPRWIDALMPTIAAEVEARVQAAASQRAAEAVEPGLSVESNGRRLAWFTDDELAAELNRRAALASPAPAPQGESVCIHGHAEDDAHVCGEPR